MDGCLMPAGVSWVSPGAVEGSCNMCNLQSQKLRAVHRCFGIRAWCSSPFWKATAHVASTDMSRHLTHQRKREKENDTHTSHLFCKYTGEGISSPSGHTCQQMKSVEAGVRKMWQCNATLTVLHEISTVFTRTDNMCYEESHFTVELNRFKTSASSAKDW